MKEDKFPIVAHDVFESLPWSDADDVVIRAFGVGYVVERTISDKQEGSRLLYQVYEPSWEKVPVLEPGESVFGNEKALHRHYMLMDGLLRKDGMYFPISGRQSLWPYGAAHPPHDGTVWKTWDAAQRARILEICRAAFPRAGEGYCKWGTVTVLAGDRLTTQDLDDLIDTDRSLEPYVGSKVFHGCFGTGILVQLKVDHKDGTPFYAARWRTPCMKERCPSKSKVTFYTMSGCHSGAWCYVCDPKTGKYLADLRNQIVVCKCCAGGTDGCED